MQNINTCAVHELFSIQGIDRKLAYTIIKYRFSRNGFQAMEELLTVPGMNKQKYQILCQKFSLVIKPPSSNVIRRPYSGLSIVPIQFVCTGKAIEEQAARKDAASRAGKRDQGGQMLPTFQDKTGSSSYCGKMGNLQVRDQTTHGKEIPRFVHKCPSQVVMSTAHRVSSSPQTDKPSDGHIDALRATTSGNTINFMCTLDKRVTEPVPFTAIPGEAWTLANKKYSRAISQATCDNGMVSHKVKAKRSASLSEGNGSESTDEERGSGKAQAKSKRTDNLSNHCTASTTKSSLKTFPTYTLNIAYMSSDNMLLYDQCNRMTSSERTYYITNWVTDVENAFFKNHKPLKLEKIAQSCSYNEKSLVDKQNEDLEINTRAGRQSPLNMKTCDRVYVYNKHMIRARPATMAPREDRIEPLHILHKRAVKSGINQYKRALRNEVVQSPDSFKQTTHLRHLMNNYVVQRSKTTSTNLRRNKIETRKTR